MQRKAFDLLLYLLDRRDQVVTKETLMQALWSNLVVEESNVTQQIFLLRKALSKHASGLKIIELQINAPRIITTGVERLHVDDHHGGGGATRDFAEETPLERVFGRLLRLVRPGRLRIALLARARRPARHCPPGK